MGRSAPPLTPFDDPGAESTPPPPAHPFVSFVSGAVGLGARPFAPHRRARRRRPRRPPPSSSPGKGRRSRPSRSRRPRTGRRAGSARHEAGRPSRVSPHSGAALAASPGGNPRGAVAAEYRQAARRRFPDTSGRPWRRHPGHSENPRAPLLQIIVGPGVNGGATPRPGPGRERGSLLNPLDGPGAESTASPAGPAVRELRERGGGVGGGVVGRAARALGRGLLALPPSRPTLGWSPSRLPRRPHVLSARQHRNLRRLAVD